MALLGLTVREYRALESGEDPVLLSTVWGADGRAMRVAAIFTGLTGWGNRRSTLRGANDGRVGDAWPLVHRTLG